MLKKLRLDQLPMLTAFCKGINNIDFPNLRELSLRYLNIKGFVTEDAEQSNDSGFLFGSKVSFGRLEELYLGGLDSELWFHQLSSTYFRQLQSFSSILDEEGGMSMKPLFPKLYKLYLGDLPKLRSFSQRKHALHFPSLQEVETRNCSEMQTFAQGYVSTRKLRILGINGVPFPVKDINNSIRQHFDEKQANAEKIAVAEEITSEEEMDKKIEIMEQVMEQITSEE